MLYQIDHVVTTQERPWNSMYGGKNKMSP